MRLDPLGRAITSVYDVIGRQISRSDARGVKVSYAYDAADRLIGRQYNNGDLPVTLSYDAVSNRTLMQDSTGRTTSSYDALNRLQAVTNPAGNTITYAYDSVGQRNWMIDPDGDRFTYAFDPAGRLQSLVNPQGDHTTFSYDAADRRMGMSLANATHTSNTYDNADRLVNVSSRLNSSGQVLLSSSYTYDNTINRTGMVEVRLVKSVMQTSIVTWSYDPTYQLIGEQRSGNLRLRQHAHV